MRLAGLSLFAVLSCLAGCGDGAVDLESCPQGDEPWAAAIREARKDDSLEELASRVETIAVGCPERWEPVWTLAQCRYHQRRRDDARRAFERALELARAADDPVGVASAINRLGGFVRRDGDLDGAAALYREGLDAANRAGRQDLAAFLEHNLAGVMMQTGDFARAVRMLERAGTVMHGLGRESPAMTADYSRGLVLLELGDVEGARELLESFHRRCLARDEPKRAVRAGVTLGRLHLMRDDPESARQWLERVPPDAGNQTARAAIYLGMLHLSEGAFDEAASAFETAATATDNDLTAGFANTFRAEVELARGNPAGALAILENVLAQVEQTGARSLEWLARWQVGRAAMRQGRVEVAIAELDRSVALLEGIGAGLGAESEGLRFLRDRTGPYVDLALAMLPRRPDRLTPQRADRILSVIERAHARALRQILAGEGEATPQVVTLDRLRAGLRPGELVLDFLIGEREGLVLAVRAEGVGAARMPGWRELRGPLRAYRQQLRRLPRDPKQPLAFTDDAQRLAALLVEPLRGWLDEARRLYVIPDGELALIPPSTWPVEGAGFVRAELGTAMMPMAGPPPRWAGDRRPLLLGGDPAPDPEGEFPELPYAAREAARVAEAWSPSEPVTLLREDFDPESFTGSGLDRFGTIHLATHAIASTRSPEQCAIVFSGGRRLGFDEIARLSLGPALVVLSACSTGEGEVVSGEGVLGLNWALLRAGARGVAVSQWSIADASTARMMETFHRAMAEGNDPPRALQIARDRQREAYPHPAHWAAFTLVLRPEAD